MLSKHTYETEIIPLSNQVDANAVHADGNVVKLFYQEHYKYGCLSNNWGASKGLDHYNDVCVVLGTTHWKIYQTSSLAALHHRQKTNSTLPSHGHAGGCIWRPKSFLNRSKLCRSDWLRRPRDARHIDQAHFSGSEGASRAVPFVDTGCSSGRHARCHERPAHTISRAIRHGPVSLLQKMRGQMMLTTRQL